MSRTPFARPHHLNPFVGTWRYRSFHNRPEQVESFDEIGLAQALLRLGGDAPDMLSGTLSFGDGADALRLNMSGTVQDTDPPTARLRATGVEGTVTAGWIYDYIGYLAPSWPFSALEGDSQRPAILGIFIRTVQHGPAQPPRPAGYSGSFVAVYVGAFGHDERNPPALAPIELPETVIAHLADRLHRMHHALWHALRNYWDIIDPDDQARIEALGWAPPRPATQYRKGLQSAPYVTNGSGEDFLFMHREMVVQYRALMAEAGQEPITWVVIPPPGAYRSPGNEIPPAWPISDVPILERRIAAVKSDEFYWSRMRWWDYEFKDPTYLATLTLGELGALLEFSVHNEMHMRWCALPRDPDTDEPLPTARPECNFDTKWDNPRYNNLYDFYSSHVNPIFWRLHGWIDDRIDDWYEAHERVHPGEVVRERRGAVEWFEPGRWVQVAHPWVWPAEFSDGGHGAHPHNGGGHDGNGHHVDPEERQRRIESMEEVIAILFGLEERERAEPGISLDEPRVSLELVFKVP